MIHRTIVRSLFSKDITNDDPTDFCFHASYLRNVEARLPLFPYRFFDVTRSRRHFFKHINYSDFALEMILSGEVKYQTEKKTDICRGGDVYVIPPGSTVSFANNTDEPRRKIVLLFVGTHTGLFADALGFCESAKITVPDPEDFEQRMRKIGDMLRRKKQNPMEKIMLAGMELLLHLRKFMLQPRIAPGILRACNLMTSEIANPMLSTESLAKLSGFSPADFRQKFYRAFGISPIKYLVKLRMEKANNLLKNSSLNIKTIAVQTGFNSAHAFSRTFTRHFGISPRKLRKNEIETVT